MLCKRGDALIVFELRRCYLKFGHIVTGADYRRILLQRTEKTLEQKRKGKLTKGSLD